MYIIGVEQDHAKRELAAKIYIACCFVGIFFLSVQCYVHLDHQIKNDVFSEILFFITITTINGSFAVNIIQFQLFLILLTIRFNVLNNFTRWAELFIFPVPILDQYQVLVNVSSRNIRDYLQEVAMKNTDSMDVMAKISKLSMIYDNLCCILKEVNAYFGIHVSDDLWIIHLYKCHTNFEHRIIDWHLQIISTTGANFVLTVFSLHCFYRGLTENNEALYHMSIGYMTLTVFFFSMSIVMFLFGSLIARTVSLFISKKKANGTEHIYPLTLSTGKVYWCHYP